MKGTKQEILQLIEHLLQQKILSPDDLRKYSRDILAADHPVIVKEEMEDWYRTSGIELITGKAFHLSDCPFSHFGAAIPFRSHTTSPSRIVSSHSSFLSPSIMNPLVSMNPNSPSLSFKSATSAHAPVLRCPSSS